jgi:predicted O-methyltransferase YrrM
MQSKSWPHPKKVESCAIKHDTLIVKPSNGIHARITKDLAGNIDLILKDFDYTKTINLHGVEQVRIEQGGLVSITNISHKPGTVQGEDISH